jgi:hypothetical protein
MTSKEHSHFSFLIWVNMFCLCLLCRISPSCLFCVYKAANSQLDAMFNLIHVNIDTKTWCEVEHSIEQYQTLFMAICMLSFGCLVVSLLFFLKVGNYAVCLSSPVQQTTLPCSNVFWHLTIFIPTSFSISKCLIIWFYNGGMPIFCSHLSNELCEEFAADFLLCTQRYFWGWAQRGFALFACKMKDFGNLAARTWPQDAIFVLQVNMHRLKYGFSMSILCNKSPHREIKQSF